MIDNGATFTMIMERVTSAHGLKMKKYNNNFHGAISGAPPGELIGIVDFALQFHPHLVLHLKNVKV